MICHIRGVEYYIILNGNYDYFDIVHDLEKKYRIRIDLKQNKLVLFNMKYFDDRLLKSSYYLDLHKENKFFDNKSRCDKINNNPIVKI